ncbi:MAG: hypothetical protein F4W92_09410 [Gammaproteobacteria bacterium]|nr:hypothetical protein [Gammaproteobacteria bacterium]
MQLMKTLILFATVWIVTNLVLAEGREIKVIDQMSPKQSLSSDFEKFVSSLTSKSEFDGKTVHKQVNRDFLPGLKRLPIGTIKSHIGLKRDFQLRPKLYDFESRSFLTAYLVDGLPPELNENNISCQSNVYAPYKVRERIPGTHVRTIKVEGKVDVSCQFSYIDPGDSAFDEMDIKWRLQVLVVPRYKFDLSTSTYYPAYGPSVTWVNAIDQHQCEHDQQWVVYHGVDVSYGISQQWKRIYEPDPYPLSGVSIDCN